MEAIAVDHLIVLARDLAEGREWVEHRLGLPMQPGGQHEAWGTHNVLLSLGPQTYLEVLAINPAVPRPGPFYPLGLGDPALARRLQQTPLLAHWMVRVDALAGDGLQEFSRGDNRWRAVLPTDGALPMGGVVPSLIEWLTPPPAGRLPASGATLRALTLTTPEPDALTRIMHGLSATGALDLVTVLAGAEPQVSATIDTPRGPVTL